MHNWWVAKTCWYSVFSFSGNFRSLAKSPSRWLIDWLMIAFIIWNSTLIPLLKGLCNSNPCKFEFSVFWIFIGISCCVIFFEGDLNIHSHEGVTGPKIPINEKMIGTRHSLPFQYFGHPSITNSNQTQNPFCLIVVQKGRFQPQPILLYSVSLIKKCNQTPCPNTEYVWLFDHGGFCSFGWVWKTIDLLSWNLV